MTALAGLTLAAATACDDSGPGASAASTPSAEAGDWKTVCDTVRKARQTALDALAPVSVALAGNGLSAQDILKASDDAKAAFTAMHLDVAAAAERAGDPRLKEKIAAYQLSVEQAIVAVEGTDGDMTKLATAIDSPALREAGEAVMVACA
jgi:hypothetical protein